jgi:ABC-2 type transport system permease protein
MEIARRALADRRRALMWWVIGSVLYALLIVGSYPSISGQDELNDLMDDYPPELIALFSGGETTFDLTSAAGYLNSQLFALVLPLLVVILAVGFGSTAIAGEEEQGTLELVMSYPVGRSRVVLEKAMVLVVLVVVLVATTYLATFGVGRAVDIDLGVANITLSWVGQVLLGVGFGFLALAVGAYRGSRAFAIAVAAGVAGASYLVGSLGPVVSWLEPAKWISPFYYATGDNPLANGVPAWHLLVLVGFCGAALAAAVVGFVRRDLRGR